MRYVITESQLDLIRRYDILKNLIDESFDVITQQDDICGYTFYDFIQEVKWQVSDHSEELKIGKVSYLHSLIELNFYEEIKEFYNGFMEENCKDGFDNDEYYSSILQNN
tara:strand:- start:1852 stop:2178 length:327 start_codon:yes stop_codon:yes gene_type:complete